MKFKCYCDGKEVFEQDLIASLQSSEINIFESLRVYDGTIFKQDEHLKRLAESARSCGIVLPSITSLRNALKKAARAHGVTDGFLRLNFDRGKVYVMVGERKHHFGIFANGVDLKTSGFRMPSPKTAVAQAKTANYRLQLLASLPEDAYEWLFLDENHFLTESRVGNFFMVKKGALLTPPGTMVLNGITRGVVIECALESGFSVRETPLTRHDFFNADEAFLTNTSWEILPVRSLDGRLIQGEIPGPVTQKLTNCFHRKVQIACQSEKSNAHLSPSQTKRA